MLKETPLTYTDILNGLGVETGLTEQVWYEMGITVNPLMSNHYVLDDVH